MTLVELFDKYDEDQRLFAAILPGWLKAFEIGARDEIVIAKAVWHSLDSEESNALGLSEFDGSKRAGSKFARRPFIKLTTAQAYLRRLIADGVNIDELAFELEAPVWLVEAAVQGLSEAFNEPYWENINETTRADIFTNLTQMIDEGESVRNTASRIMAGNPAYSRARATAVARTEMTNAMNAGHVAGIKQIQEESGLAMSKEWLSVLGTTTRDSHADADAQEVPVDDDFIVGDYRASRPGHQSLPAKERCNCFPASTRVRGVFVGAMRAWYQGRFTEIVTALGRVLTLTPNHPVATPNGWIAASEIKQGDHVLAYEPHIEGSTAAGSNHIENEPSPISEVFEAFRGSFLSKLRGRGPLDFDGDSQSMVGDIDVVTMDGPLNNDWESSGFEQANKGSFAIKDVIKRLGSRKSPFNNGRLSPLGTTDSIPSLANQPLSGGGSVGTFEVAPSGPLAIGVTSDFNATFAKAANQERSVVAGFLRDSLQGDSGLITADYVVEVRDFNASCHVYDLQSVHGMIIAQGPESSIDTGGIITANCQCTVLSGFITDAIPSGAESAAAQEIEVPEEPAPGPAPEPKPASDPIVPPPPKKPPGIPSFVNLTDQSAAGGSTGARIMTDEDGKRYVVKRGSSPDHLREEVLADRLYELLGADVPKSKFEIGPDGEPVKITPFLEGSKPYNQLTAEEKKVVDRKIQKRFAADSLLGNWDVMGADNDNILIDSAGNPFRIDNGGSLRYRAMGERKGDAFADQVLDFWTLKDKNVNAKSAAVFGDVSHDAMIRQSTAILKKRDKLMKQVEKLGVELYGERQYELEDKMRARLDSMQRVVDTSLEFKKSDFNAGYRDDICRHRERLVNAGVFDGKADKLNRYKDKGVVVVDEGGKAWDGLRGRDSVTAKLADYVNNDIHPKAYDALERYADHQAGDSFSEGALARKQALLDGMEKNVKWDEFYWNGETKKSVKKAFENQADYLDGAKRGLSPDDALKEAYAAHHAMTFHVLKTTEFDNNDTKQGAISIARTEARDLIENVYGVKEGESKVIKRGAAESFSIYEQVVVHARDPVLMVQEIPHAQVFGGYFQERTPGKGNSLFMDDAENEFVAMSRNVKTKNLGSAKRGGNIPRREEWREQ